MRVGVDARHLAGGRGVAHYTSELLAALAARFPDDEWVAVAPGRGPLAGSGAARVVRHPLPSRLVFGSAALAGRPRLDRLAGGADVVWLPAPAPVAIARGVPHVLTVHDLAWLERPGDFTAYERLWHRLGRLERLAARARVVVTVSEATRRTVLDRWRSVDPARLRVVNSGIPALPPPAPRPEWLPRTFFLAVGALEPRKAPDLLARAFAAARARGLDADLVFAGEGRLAAQLDGDGVHVVGGDRATVATLYEHALALALPSHLEGFGFTPLEAARAGLPVVASDLPAVTETLGDAALRVPPGDEAAWADALCTLATDAELRARLAAEGRRAAGRFSWDRAAAELHRALSEAAAR